MFVQQVGRDLDHIKRINIIITHQVKNSQANKLSQNILVEVFSPGQGENWSGITEKIQESEWFICKAQIFMQEKVGSNEVMEEIEYDDSGKRYYAYVQPIEDK